MSYVRTGPLGKIALGYAILATLTATSGCGETDATPTQVGVSDRPAIADAPSPAPRNTPSATSTRVPTSTPSESPKPTPSDTPSPVPTAPAPPTRTPTQSPQTATPTSVGPAAATETPSPRPALSPIPEREASPTAEPVQSPTVAPQPSPTPTALPTASPTLTVVPSPTLTPTSLPTASPTPTVSPTSLPTETPPPTVAPSPSAPPSKTGPDVTIRCIFFDGIVSRFEPDEYVEITNLGDTAQQLSGWRLLDVADGRPEFTFSSRTLGPGETVRVYTNEVHEESGGFSFGRGSAIWSNSAPDEAALYDETGALVSRKSYPPGC